MLSNRGLTPRPLALPLFLGLCLSEYSGKACCFPPCQSVHFPPLLQVPPPLPPPPPHFPPSTLAHSWFVSIASEREPLPPTDPWRSATNQRRGAIMPLCVSRPWRKFAHIATSDRATPRPRDEQLFSTRCFHFEMRTIFLILSRLYELVITQVRNSSLSSEKAWLHETSVDFIIHPAEVVNSLPVVHKLFYLTGGNHPSETSVCDCNMHSHWSVWSFINTVVVAVNRHLYFILFLISIVVIKYVPEHCFLSLSKGLAASEAHEQMETILLFIVKKTNAIRKLPFSSSTPCTLAVLQRESSCLL